MRRGAASGPLLRSGGLVLAMLAVLAVLACKPVGPAASAPPEDPVALGVLLMQQDQPGPALRAFNRALANAVTAEALSGAGSAYHALGQRDQAEQLLRAAIKRDPNYALARNNLGIILYERGDYALAERQFRSAFAITGGANREIARNLAFAEFALSQVAPVVPKAQEDFDVIQYGHGLFRLERSDEDQS